MLGNWTFETHTQEDAREEDTEVTSEYESIPNYVPKRYHNLYRARHNQLAPQGLSTSSKKALVSPKDLNSREREVYRRIVSMGDHDLEEHLNWMDMALNGKTGKISGRMVDSLVTSYPSHASVYYYIDESTSPTTYKPYKDRKSVV